MMTNKYKLGVTFIVTVGLYACGGGGEETSPAPAATAPATVTAAPAPATTSPSPAPVAEPPLATSELVAPADFDFRVDRDVQVNLSNGQNIQGVINVYHATAFYDDSLDKHYPDYNSLVASWRVSAGEQYTLMLNSNWQSVLFEWVPESPTALEQNFYFKQSEVAQTITLNL